MESHRQAALALHGLHEADRDWLLAQLPGADRAQLDQLLAELRELGIPRDAAVIPKAEAPRAQVPAMPRDRIRAASVRAVRAALAAQAPGVIAACLAIEDWPWRAAFIAKIPRRCRAGLVELVRRRCAGPVPERLRAALIAGMDARLAARAAPVGRFARWRQWMRGQWMRGQWTTR